MKKFWISFFSSPSISLIHGLELGYGVTANDADHALAMIYDKVFKEDRPVVKKIVEDFDVKTVDKKHVYLNMGNPEISGIWFPLGYDQFDPIH